MIAAKAKLGRSEQAIDDVVVLSNAVVIAVSREDPKFLRVDDAEIVGDG
jgi:hypothetical protein